MLIEKEIIDILAIIQEQRRETELVRESAVSAIVTTHWLQYEIDDMPDYLAMP